jgi:hypothetical protein
MTYPTLRTSKASVVAILLRGITTLEDLLFQASFEDSQERYSGGKEAYKKQKHGSVSTALLIPRFCVMIAVA